MSILGQDIQKIQQKNVNAKVISKSLCSVHLDLGNGKRRIIATTGPAYYKKNGQWEDIDVNLVDEGNKWAIRKTLAEVEFSKNDIPTIKYNVGNKSFSFKPVKLQFIDKNENTELVSEFIPDRQVEVVGNKIKWIDAFGQGIHLQYTCGSNQLRKDVIIEDFAVLPEPTLTEDVRFEVVLEMESNLMLENYSHLNLKNLRMEKLGFDSENEGINGFVHLMIPRYRDSGIQLSPDPENDFFETIGKRRIFEKQNKTFITTSVQYEWLKHALYPVFIDTDVDYQVGASGDDGDRRSDGTYYSYIGTGLLLGWQHALPYVNNRGMDCCMRFTGVAVPQGATIDSAKMQWYLSSVVGGGPVNNNYCYGIDEDNTATMTSDPFERTTTTAKSDFDGAEWGSVATGAFRDTPSITTIVKEIVDRENWSSENAMGFLCFGSGNTDEQNYMNTYSYDQSGNVSGPKLFISYTAGAPTDTSKMFLMWP